jgi:hypothetical protein
VDEHSYSSSPVYHKNKTQKDMSNQVSPIGSDSENKTKDEDNQNSLFFPLSTEIIAKTPKDQETKVLKIQNLQHGKFVKFTYNLI